MTTCVCGDPVADHLDGTGCCNWCSCSYYQGMDDPGGPLIIAPYAKYNGRYSGMKMETP